MGEFISEHFVAAFQQAGDFEVVNIDGRLRKDGGNVASVFCTPDARVIHAVGGAVSAERLLREARWAVDVYQRALEYAGDDALAQAQFVEREHLAKLRASPQDFRGEIYKRLPKAREDYSKQLQDYAKRRAEGRSNYRQPPRLVPPEIMARRQAAEHFGGERAHQIMAAEPLAPFGQVRERIFERLTGERYAQRRDRVYLAGERLRQARESRVPVVLVLYRGGGRHRDEYDDGTEKLIYETFRQQPVSGALQSFAVVVLPLRELSALTQLAELPPYELASRSSPTVIIARPDGEQVTAMQGTIYAGQLAAHLWPLAGEAAMEQAEQFVQDGKVSDALRLLRRFAAAPVGEEVHRRIDHRIATVSYDLAKDWAAAGRTNSALRMFHRLKNEAPDDGLRQRAGEQVAQLRAGLGRS